jgi:hypothetical protein
LSYEELIKSTKILEYYGLVNRIERYNKLGITFHDDVLEQLKTIFKEDSLTLKYVFSKFLKFMKNKIKPLEANFDDPMQIEQLKNNYKEENFKVVSLQKRILHFIKFKKDFDTKKVKLNHLWEEFYYHMLALCDRNGLESRLSINKFKNEIFDSLVLFEPKGLFIVETVNYTRFPSDLVHLMMCKDVYRKEHEKRKESKEKINFNNENWIVSEVYIEETNTLKMCKFKAVVYKNEVRRQMVVAFKGLEPKIKDIFSKEGGFTNSVEAIFTKGITAQLVKCFHVTHISYIDAKNRNYSLSFTGFSNGAWLAEHAINFIPYIDNEYNLTKVRAVLFDSHGIFKENQTTNNKDMSENIICYLSNPNFANSCNKHYGNVYRIFIEYKDDSFKEEEKIVSQIQDMVTSSKKIVDRIKGVLSFASTVPVNDALAAGAEISENVMSNKTFIKNLTFFLAGLKSLFNPKIIDSFLEQFNRESGKPNYYEKVIEWPLLKVNLSKGFRNNFQNLLEKPIKNIVKLIPYPDYIKKPVEILGTILLKNIANAVMENFLPGAHLIINILYELWENNIDFSILDNPLFGLKIRIGLKIMPRN